MGKGGRSGRIVNDYGPKLAPKGGTTKKKLEEHKEKPSAKTLKEEPLEVLVLVPLKLQQLTLNIFKDTFPDTLSSDKLQPLLQEIKSALFERDFERAFGRKDYLEAYSVRWSPSRALCYQAILIDLRHHLAKVFGFRPSDTREDGVPSKPTLRVICFGGGAAEVVAFGGYLRYMHDTAATNHQVNDSDPKIECQFDSESVSDLDFKPHHPTTVTVANIDMLLIDSATWQDVTSSLSKALTALPPLSKYANSLAKETNSSLVPHGSFSSASIVENVLEMDLGRLIYVVGGHSSLITLLFTLNELYTASISKTTTFLLNLTAAAGSGTLLLVVDSPGSYSETQIGTEAKKYPMQWLLDHTFLESKDAKGQVTPASWERVVSDNSRWLRIPEILRYPIPLENMRCQMHLYRRL